MSQTNPLEWLDEALRQWSDERTAPLMKQPKETTKVIEEELTLLDLNPKHIVEVVVKNNKLWVNVDGLCRLRASACPEIVVRDERPQVEDKHEADANNEAFRRGRQ